MTPMEMIQKLDRMAALEYQRGRDDGYAQALKDVEAMLAQWLAARQEPEVATPRPDPPAPPKNTKTQQLLEFVREHPGATRADMREHGFAGEGLIYNLVKEGLVEKREAAERVHGEPSVRFYVNDARA